MDKTKLMDKYWNKYRENIARFSLREQSPEVRENTRYFQLDRMARGRRIEETTITALECSDFTHEEISKFSVLDIACGNPFLWGFLNEMYGVNNFVGVDRISKDLFKDLVIDKNLKYSYYDHSVFSLNTLEELKGQKFDLVVSSIDDDNIVLSNKFLKDHSVLVYNYTDFRIYK